MKIPILNLFLSPGGEILLNGKIERLRAKSMKKSMDIYR